MSNKPFVPADPSKASRRNLRMALACAGVFVGMVGLAFASVPLYSLLCKATGLGGTPKTVESADGVQVLDQLVTVRFDANISPTLEWSFAPDQPEVTLKIGETRTIYYHAKNLSDKEITGTAAFNVTPDAAGSYFSKIECFCFTEQHLAPGETKELGVTFYVDPALVDDPDAKSIKTITLSYSFFPVANPTRPIAALETAKDGLDKL